MITLHKGDIVEVAREHKIQYIAHGCNCFHRMGAGIAKYLNAHFDCLKEDKRATQRGDPSKLGSFSVTYVPDEPFNILNCYTQYSPGANFDIAFLQRFLRKLSYELKEANTSIIFPRIGCGIGGGNWVEVEDLLLEFAEENTNIQVHIVTF